MPWHQLSCLCLRPAPTPLLTGDTGVGNTLSPDCPDHKKYPPPAQALLSTLATERTDALESSLHCPNLTSSSAKKALKTPSRLPRGTARYRLSSRRRPFRVSHLLRGYRCSSCSMALQQRELNYICYMQNQLLLSSCMCVSCRLALQQHRGSLKQAEIMEATWCTCGGAAPRAWPCCSSILRDHKHPRLTLSLHLPGTRLFQGPESSKMPHLTGQEPSAPSWPCSLQQNTV